MYEKKVMICFVVFTFLFAACSDKENEIGLSKKNVVIEKPDDGFLLRCQHEDGVVDIITGNDFRNFVRFRTEERGIITSDFNVLYAYEDIGDITLSDKRDDSFTLNAFNDEFEVYDIKDVEGGVNFKVKQVGSEVLNATLQYDSLNKNELLKDLYSFGVVPNPFSNGQEMKGPVTIALIGAAAVVVSSVIVVVGEILQDDCNNQRKIDEHNCRNSSKKCLKANGRCHYTCITCPK